MKHDLLTGSQPTEPEESCGSNFCPEILQDPSEIDSAMSVRQQINDLTMPDVQRQGQNVNHHQPQANGFQSLASELQELKDSTHDEGDTAQEPGETSHSKSHTKDSAISARQPFQDPSMPDVQRPEDDVNHYQSQANVFQFQASDFQNSKDSTHDKGVAANEPEETSQNEFHIKGAQAWLEDMFDPTRWTPVKARPTVGMRRLGYPLGASSQLQDELEISPKRMKTGVGMKKTGGKKIRPPESMATPSSNTEMHHQNTASDASADAISGNGPATNLGL